MAEAQLYNTPVHPITQDSDIIRYQIDPENDLQQLAYELKGYVYKENVNTWVKGGKPLIDEEDANKIIALVAPIMRKQWTLSIMEKARILELTRDLWIATLRILWTSGKYDNPTVLLVRNKVVNYALPNMMRSKDGETMKNIITRIEKREIEERSRKQREGILSSFSPFGRGKKGDEG